MLVHVKALCSQFAPQGQRSMPRPTPDIDLILTDEAYGLPADASNALRTPINDQGVNIDEASIDEIIR